MVKKVLTDREKIEKFIKWLKEQKESANGTASGGSSSWNWAYVEACEKIYRKAKVVFKEDLKKEIL